MATNGVILLNLDNRNAAEFDRILVPDSLDKAFGALESGAFVTVYKWLYQGFMMGPSLCNAVLSSDHINLVDKTNGGILEVYPDDTIYLRGSSSSAVINPLVVSDNGTYSAPAGVDGYSPVTVNVSGEDPAVINPLVVNDNGVYSAPEGVDGYSPVTVNVSSGQPVTTQLSVNENGSYSPPEGVDGFNNVVVDVPSTQPSIQSKIITANGSYEVPAGVDGFNPVLVLVPQTIRYPIPRNSSGIFFDDYDAFTNVIGFHYAVETDASGSVSIGASQMVWRPNSYTLGEVYTGTSQDPDIALPFDLIYVNRTQIASPYCIWDYVVIPRAAAYIFRVNGNLDSPDESYYVPSGKPFGIRAEGKAQFNYGWLMLRA